MNEGSNSEKWTGTGMQEGIHVSMSTTEKGSARMTDSMGKCLEDTL